jgi:hypothetical protein
MTVLTKKEAHARFGKKHRIGRCSKCSTLYVWSTPSNRQLNLDNCPVRGRALAHHLGEEVGAGAPMKKLSGANIPEVQRKTVQRKLRITPAADAKLNELAIVARMPASRLIEAMIQLEHDALVKRKR